MSRNIWRTKEGQAIPMSDMNEQEIQEALLFAEKYHIHSENAIQKSLRNSKIFLDKALELKKVAQEKGIKVESLHEKFPGKYTILENTYRLLQQ